MQIKTVEFVKSSSRWQECPEGNKAEYAFIGRSNVGKSSLINALMNRKGLAKISQTPGKTQLINHFFVNDEWFLTDLPGYGYAKVSKSSRKEFAKIITNYILERKNLVNLYILVDSRHEPQKIDLEFMEWCGECGIPFSIIFTKTDKLGPKIVEQNVEIYKVKLLEQWEELPVLFLSSAEKKQGCTAILDHIKSTNLYLKQNHIYF